MKDFKYIIIEDEPCLAEIIVETPMLKFYQTRPKMTGGGFNSGGMFQNHGTKLYPYFIKGKDNEAQPADFGKNLKNIGEYFSDCPRMIQYAKDKKIRPTFQMYTSMAYVFNGNCEEASVEQTKKDISEMQRINQERRAKDLQRIRYVMERKEAEKEQKKK